MRNLTLAALLAASTLGCTGQVRGPDAGDALERSLARVSLSFTRDAREVRGSAPRFAAEGHFVRHRGGDSARVATVLGVADEGALALDTCRLVDGAEEIDRALAGQSPEAVELLDAGRLAIKGPFDATLLQPRHYPELTPYIAGVVYGLGDTAPLQLEPGALYEVTGDGGEEVGPFEAQAPAPRAFPTLSILPFRRGDDLDLRWIEAGEVSDPMVIAVSWIGKSGAREVRCRVRDDGSFRVARDLLVGTEAGAIAEITATRVRRAPLFAPGAGRGELTIGLREIVALPDSPQ
ncbi:MAG: hypothetical protein EXR72_26750 [Myxococcales bacterium]|nr:hypothetical protein [Myxococcales bacterium]